MATDILFQAGRIGKLALPNRFIRAASYETMATKTGEVTDDLLDLYRALSKGGIGLVITGHAYVHPRGQYGARQLGIYDDSFIPGLRHLVEVAHQRQGLIFCQLAHAGSQSQPGVSYTPLAPSSIPNPLYGKTPPEATEDEIREAIQSFEAAAKRAMAAGFDGIHIHGANGYLISEFNSPFSNRRTDDWGGDAQRRGLLVEEIYKAIRKAVGPDVPITVKLGVADAIAGGLQEEESVERAARLESLGLDGIEVSCGVMAFDSFATASCQMYVAVDWKRAFADHLYYRVFSKPAEEAYFLGHARAMKRRLRIPVILVGGLRSVERMGRVLKDGDADFIAMSRPFIREPDLVNRIYEGQTKIAKCTSCNICLLHEGKDSLRCWRESCGGLLSHAWKYYVRDRLFR